MLPIAYNSGPGTLQMWLKNNHDYKDDPLLFIATIPYRETRTFVKKVLANYWIYQQLLGEKNTSADMIINNEWPKVE
jgi:soluble lytic murein transglycosylase-like protein